MADFMYTRGARRSAAPTYNRWNAPQSAAQSSEQLLAALLRQPQEAQQADPRMMERNAPQQRQQLGGIDPAALQSMIRQQALAQQQARDERAFGTKSAEGDVNQTEAGAAMGPASPTTMRALKTMMTLGLGGMGLGPIAALLSGALSNPDSATAPTAALGTSVIKSKVSALGAVDLLAQMFGVDPIVKEVDKQLQAITQPTQDTQAGAAGPSATDAATQQSMGNFGWSDQWGWGSEATGANFSDQGPGGSSGTAQYAGGSYVNGIAYGPDGYSGDGSDTESGGRRGAFGGGSGSFGEGQY